MGVQPAFGTYQGIYRDASRPALLPHPPRTALPQATAGCLRSPPRKFKLVRPCPNRPPTPPVSRNNMPHLRHRHAFGWLGARPGTDEARIYSDRCLWGHRPTDVSINLKPLHSMGYAVGAKMREATWRSPTNSPQGSTASLRSIAGRGLLAGGLGARDGGVFPATDSFLSLPSLPPSAVESPVQEQKRLKVRRGRTPGCGTSDATAHVQHCLSRTRSSPDPLTALLLYVPSGVHRQSGARSVAFPSVTRSSTVRQATASPLGTWELAHRYRPRSLTAAFNATAG